MLVWMICVFNLLVLLHAIEYFLCTFLHQLTLALLFAAANILLTETGDVKVYKRSIWDHY